MPRKPKTNWTIKATARDGKGQRRRIQKILDQERELYNTTLTVLESAHQASASMDLDHLEKWLTQVRKENTQHTQVLRRLSISTLKRATTAWNGHVNPKEGKTPRGKPREKTTGRFRTITLDSPVHPIIRSSIQGGKPYLCIRSQPRRASPNRGHPPGQRLSLPKQIGKLWKEGTRSIPITLESATGHYEIAYSRICLHSRLATYPPRARPSERPGPGVQKGAQHDAAGQT